MTPGLFFFLFSNADSLVARTPPEQISTINTTTYLAMISATGVTYYTHRDIPQTAVQSFMG